MCFPGASFMRIYSGYNEQGSFWSQFLPWFIKMAHHKIAPLVNCTREISAVKQQQKCNSIRKKLHWPNEMVVLHFGSAPNSEKVVLLRRSLHNRMLCLTLLMLMSSFVFPSMTVMLSADSDLVAWTLVTDSKVRWLELGNRWLNCNNGASPRHTVLPQE